MILFLRGPRGLFDQINDETIQITVQKIFGVTFSCDPLKFGQCYWPG